MFFIIKKKAITQGMFIFGNISAPDLPFPAYNHETTYGPLL